MPHFTKSILFFLITLVAVVALAGCGGDDGDDEDGGNGGDEEGTTAPVDVPGVSDTEILLGTHLPMSGSAAAAFAPVATGLRAYFDYINDEEGGVHGRKIKLIVGDDHYNPPDTAEVVRKLVEVDEVFAIIAGVGDETHAAVSTYLEERGVPDMFVGSGVHRFTEPPVKTRFGGLPDYEVETRMLGEYIAENYPGKKLGVLRENNEMGTDGMRGLDLALEGSGVEIVGDEKCEAIDADTSKQTQRLKNSGAEVLLSITGPVQAASLTKTARETLSWDVPILVSGVDCSEIFILLAGQENAQGVVSVVFGHQVYETDIPGVQLHREIIAKYGQGIDPTNYSLYGSFLAELMVEALKRAGPDLTREGLIEATESIRDFTCSTCVAPVNLSPTDHRPQEIEVYNRVEGDRWVTFGEPVSFETTP